MTKIAAILSNGGGACVGNASINALRNNLKLAGYGKILGVNDGYNGLLSGVLIDITDAIIPIFEAGSFLGSLRNSPMVKSAGKFDLSLNKTKRMLASLTKHNVELLVVIGGNGTLAATAEFNDFIQNSQSQYTLQIMGFPLTIDNDVGTNTDFRGISINLCPGFPSAAEKVAVAVANARPIAQSARRGIIIETMGEDTGWLASSACLSNPDFILIPEFFSRDSYSKLFQLIEVVFDRCQNIVIVVAEGVRFDTHEKSISGWSSVRESGKGGAAVYLCHAFNSQPKSITEVGRKFLDTRSEFIEFRPHHTDYTPRMGKPSQYDLKLVEVLARKIGNAAKESIFGCIPHLTKAVAFDDLNDSITGLIDLKKIKIRSMPKELFDPALYAPTSVLRSLMRNITSCARGDFSPD